MDKKEQQRMAQKALYEKRKKEEEAQEKRKNQKKLSTNWQVQIDRDQFQPGTTNEPKPSCKRYCVCLVERPFFKESQHTPKVERI